MDGIEQLAEVIAGVLGMIAVMSVLGTLWRIAAYILQAVGLQTIAKRRNIRRPWLAWIPLADYYLMGCVSDQYQQVARLHNSRRRVWLLLLGIANTVAGVVLTIMMVPMLLDFLGMISGVATGSINQAMLYDMLDEMMFSSMKLSSVASVVNLLSLVYTVFYFVVLHDIYASCTPDSKTMLLVLSIFFGFLIPIFLFAYRKRDEGMQPPQQVSFNGWNPPQQP